MGAATTDVAPAGPKARAVPRRVLRDTLPRVTEELAAMLAADAAPAKPWTREEFQVAHAAAIIHGISPLLVQRPAAAVAADWRAFLAAQRVQTESRYLAVASVLAQVETSGRQAGIAFIALKGAALHALGLYTPGERPMADLDLLVAYRDLEPMSQLLEPLGYRVVAVHSSVWTMLPAERPRVVQLAEHAGNGVTIELHASISAPMPVRQVDITPSLWPVAPRPGRNGYPAVSALMTHLLHHAAVNMQQRMLRMIQLHDIALLAARMSRDDWQRVVDPGQPHGSWWAAPPLRLVQRYYPTAAPEAVCTALEARCSRLLRFNARRTRLSALSASNPRRSMIPALAWSRSSSEALHCVARRLARSAHALGGGKGVPGITELQAWTTPPSYRQAMLNVLRGRPRPETVMMVAAALDDEFSVGADQWQPSAA